MSLKSQLMDLLARSYEQEIALAQGLDDHERHAEGTEDHWTAKDVLVHLAEWKKRTRQNLDLVRRGESVPQLGDIDKANAEIFREYRGLEWSGVLAMLRQAQEGLIDLVRSLDDDELSHTATPGAGEGQPLWRRIVGAGYMHSRLHLAQLQIERGHQEGAVSMMHDSTEALMMLDDSPVWQGTLIYNLACVEALAGQSDKAIAALREALRLAPNLGEWSRQDPDLNSLRSEPGYLSLHCN